MDIFEIIAEFVIFNLLGMKNGEPFTDAVEFFIADAIKVILLLALMVFLVSILRTFVTPLRVRKLLGGSKEGAGNVIAALLGVPTPFCSCSAVPLFIGLMEAGVPLGVTFSFLVSSPLINEVAIALLLGLFGVKIAALYIGTGLVIAIGAGFLIGRLNLESEVEGFVYDIRSKKLEEKGLDWKKRLKFARIQTQDTILKVGPFVLLGIGLGAFIHGFVPVGSLASLAGSDNPFAVPLVVLIGVPLYSNAAGTIPIVQALMEKGMGIGTALAFMMSVTGLSLPEMIILRRVLKPKLLIAFVLILAVSFVAVGLLFNVLLS